mgnify:CR=1 FL=1
MQFFQREQVRGNIFTDRGMRTTTRFDSKNSICIQRIVAYEKLTILFCENVIGHHRQFELLPQATAKFEEQRGFATSDRPTDANRKTPGRKIPVNRLFPLMKMPWMLHGFMSMPDSPVMMMMFVC